jgi:hypothetical protein
MQMPALEAPKMKNTQRGAGVSFGSVINALNAITRQHPESVPSRSTWRAQFAPMLRRSAAAAARVLVDELTH